MSHRRMGLITIIELTCEDVVHNQRHGIDVNLVLDDTSNMAVWITQKQMVDFKGQEWPFMGTNTI